MKNFNLDKFKNNLKENKAQRNIIIGIIAVIVLFLLVVGYKNVYVPHRIESIAENNGFTESAGYTCNVKHQGHVVTITTNKRADQQILKEAYNTGFADETLPTEAQLGKVANAVSGIPMSGKWKIELKAQGAKKGASIWSFNGKKEVAKFQNTSLYEQCRSELEQEQKSAQDEADFENELNLAGGLLDGLAGVFDSFDHAGEQNNSSVDWGSIADRAGNAAAETPQP